MNYRELKIFAGNSNIPLARSIAKNLEETWGNVRWENSAMERPA